MFDPNLLLTALILAVVQFVAALPWLRAIDPRGFRDFVGTAGGLVLGVAGLLAFALGLSVYLYFKRDAASLVTEGRIYAAILHLQILADLFILVPALLVVVLPKTGAIALAAFREGCRQPLFWLVIGVAAVATWVSVVIPYFTFGDDFKMMKQIAFDIVMLAAVLFGVLATATSISEEIEGRTALTVMSKPVNRRQFLLGKFLGTLMACAAMTLLLGWNMNGACLATPEFDPINRDRAFDPMPEEAKGHLVPILQSVFPQGPGQVIAQGIGFWLGETLANTLGLALGFGQVMVLVAIATALATRLPFVVNLVVNLFVYFLGHLAPVVVRVNENSGDQTNPVVALIRFLANLFDTLLPSLEFFNMGPAIIRDTPLAVVPFALYTVMVLGYAVIYTVIALLVGLILFEDRDLA